MPRHLIVSCGTSQIEKAIIHSRRLCLDSDAIRDIRSLRSTALNNDNELTNIANRSETRALIAALVNVWSRLNPEIGTDSNVFGAEVSTLARMKERGVVFAGNEVSVFDPSQDHVTIISTDTQNGAACAVVLKGLLTDNGAWSMNGRVEVARVAGLREGINDPTEVEISLSRCIKQCIDHKVDFENISVVTGGYKSVIPFFTVMALLKGMPMYYLFEGEGTLRDFRLPLEVRSEVSSFTQKLLNRFRQSPEMAGGMVVTLKAAVEDGSDEPQL